MIERDPFAILGLKYGTDLDAVTKRYKELAKKYHPDLSPGNEDKMQEINEAYDAIKRGSYHAEVYYYPPKGSREAQQAAGAEQRAAETAAAQNQTQQQQKVYWYYKGIPMSKGKVIALVLLRRIVLPLLAILAGFLVLLFAWHSIFGTNLIHEVVEAFKITGDTFSEASNNFGLISQLVLEP